jgi:hypothetical protein
VIAGNCNKISASGTARDEQVCRQGVFKTGALSQLATLPIRQNQLIVTTLSTAAAAPKKLREQKVSLFCVSVFRLGGVRGSHMPFSDHLANPVYFLLTYP